MSDVVEIYTQFKRPPLVCEFNSGEEVVERDGYVPADVRIRSLIEAGARLDVSRAEQFDYQEGEEVGDDIRIDPTRRPGFDSIDAANLARGVGGRLAEQRKAAAVKAAEAKAVEDKEFEEFKASRKKEDSLKEDAAKNE